MTTRPILGNSNVAIQCTFTIIQYCIIYINMAVGLAIYSKARAFKAKAQAKDKHPWIYDIV